MNHEIRMFTETMRAVETGFWKTENGEGHLEHTIEQLMEAEVFLPGTLDDALKNVQLTKTENRCVYDTKNIDSFALAMEMLKENDVPVLVLNLANSVHPGGGVRRGARAQEEDLCRKSSLLISLEGPYAKPYYAYNRRLHTYMGSDGIIISPNVEIIRDCHGQLMEKPVTVSVITCAAPDLRYGKEGMSEEEYMNLLYNRISCIFKAAALKGCRRIVPGAFGCGAFYNDAKDVAGVFDQVLRNLKINGFTCDELFDEIRFAVLCRRNLYNFEVFSDFFEEIRN